MGKEAAQDLLLAHAVSSAFLSTVCSCSRAQHLQDMALVTDTAIGKGLSSKVQYISARECPQHACGMYVGRPSGPKIHPW